MQVALNQHRGGGHVRNVFAMKRTKVTVVAAGALLVLSGCSPEGAGSATTSLTTPVTVPKYAATLQEKIPAMMKSTAMPGAVVLIKSPKQGDWSGTFGTAKLGKKVPMSLKDYFRIGSNTKTMTSTVILQLVQEGKVSLNDPISKFRPDIPNGQNITITQLSEMRSGLYSYTFDPGFNATLDSDPGKAWTPDELLTIAFAHPADFA
ncbi:MAG TPA: serine hydrolase, partial [Humibacter sp.]|nr:serine hydrolase [Humibacter sp.]